MLVDNESALERGRWIGFSEDDAKSNRRRRKYQAATPHILPTR
jgi:hypothetical protein